MFKRIFTIGIVVTGTIGMVMAAGCSNPPRASQPRYGQPTQQTYDQNYNNGASSGSGSRSQPATQGSGSR